MKINSRKLLLFLYCPDQDRIVRAGYEVLGHLFPDLSDGGLRSIVHHLGKRGYVNREVIAGNTFFSLSELGKQWLKQYYPRFLGTQQVTSNEWSCLIFKEGSSRLKKRVALEKLLKKEGFRAAPGVYYFSYVSLTFFKHILNIYGDIVTMHRVSEWLVGAPQLNTRQKQLLADLKASFSGISRELDTLLDTKKQSSGLMNQSNFNIYSSFHRIFSFAEQLSSLQIVVTDEFFSGDRLLSRFHQSSKL